MIDGRTTDIDVRRPPHVLGQQVHRPAGERVAQVAWVLIDGLSQGRLEVGIGLGRTPGALARPEGRKPLAVELVNPAGYGQGTARDDLGDLLDLEPLGGQMNCLHSPVDVQVRRPLP